MLSVLEAESHDRNAGEAREDEEMFLRDIQEDIDTREHVNLTGSEKLFKHQRNLMK